MLQVGLQNRGEEVLAGLNSWDLSCQWQRTPKSCQVLCKQDHPYLCYECEVVNECVW